MAIRKRVKGAPIQRANVCTTERPPEPKTSTFDGVPKEHQLGLQRRIAWVGGLPAPKYLPVQDLLNMVRQRNWDDNVEAVYRDRIKSPLTGIRAFCVFCAGGSPKAATECSTVHCSLWPFRTGKNPFFGKLKGADTEVSDDDE